MKLHTRFSGYYVVASVLLFLAAGITFPILLKNIFYRQIDENLNTERILITETIGHADTLPDFHSDFGHYLEVTLTGRVMKPERFIRDTSIINDSTGSMNLFRHMHVAGNSDNGRGFIIEIYKSLTSTRRLVEDIFFVEIVLFVFLLLLLVTVNYFVARRSWVPFYRTLKQLQHYDVRQDKPLELVPSRIYEFAELNKALDRMSKKIQRDFLTLKQFNENAAHELQTPLAVIRSKLDLLVQQENLTSEQMELIGTVYESISRMSRLSQGLLLLSKIDNNQYRQEKEIDLAKVTERILSHLSEFVEHNSLTVKFDDKAPFPVRMDPSLADILVNNLLSNAIRHNLYGGTIHITTREHCLEITNTGMPPGAEPEELFERFRKGGGKTDSIGLGLAIVKKIADFYGFRVEYRYLDNLHTLKIC